MLEIASEGMRARAEQIVVERTSGRSGRKRPNLYSVGVRWPATLAAWLIFGLVAFVVLWWVVPCALWREFRVAFGSTHQRATRYARRVMDEA